MARRRVKSLVIALLVVAMLAGSANLAGAAAANVKSRWLIGFRTEVGNAEAALVHAFGGENLRVLHIVPVIAADLPLHAAEALQHNPLVSYVEADGEVHALAEQTPWGITKVNAGDVWSDGDTGAGIKVAVLDTGVDSSHPDLAANIAGGYNSYANNTNYEDDHGHGTHVAGTILAIDNEIGVIGVAHQADLIAIKVLNASGSGSWETVAAGIDKAVALGAKIISMSLGGDAGSTTLEDACNAAYTAGVLVVAAAGNDGKRTGTGDNVDFPGRYESVMAVAATDINNVRATWSSTGPAVEIAAPGVSVYSTYFGDTYATMSGTSMATPHVSGVAALLWAAKPGLTNVEVRGLLTATATDLGATGKDNLYGYGLVNAKAAYDAAMGGTINTPPTCTIAAPASAGTVSGTVNVEVAAGDGQDAAGTLTVTVKVDGTSLGTAGWNPGIGRYVISWDTTTVADGSHTITATATDSAGAATNATPVTVTVLNATGGDYTSGDLEPATWTASGNPVGKTVRKDYYFTPPAVSYGAITVAVQGTSTITRTPTPTFTAYLNGTPIGSTTLSGGTLNLTFTDTPATLIPGSSNTLRLEVGLLYKGESVSITLVIVSLTAE